MEQRLSDHGVVANCSADILVCGFTELSSSVSMDYERKLGTGKSPEPADKNVCATKLLRKLVFELREGVVGKPAGG